MPQNNPITIKDGATTPADHVFGPVSTLNGNARFENTASSLSLGHRESLTVSLKRPARGGRSTYETTVQLDIPVVKSVEGASGTVDVLQYTNRAIVQIVVDPRATSQQRKDVRVLAANALLNMSIAVAADNAENFW